jgi:hypothetical protein
MSDNVEEIIRKLYFLVWWKSPPEGYPRHPPPLREQLPHIFHVLDGKWEWDVRYLLAIITYRGGGEGGVICETVPFVNGSSDKLQTPNQDSQYYSAPRFV